LKHHYTKAQLIEGLQKVGVRVGDHIFVHSNIGYFGYAEGASSAVQCAQLILDALKEVVSAKGTVVVPTFTYSYCKEQSFDPAHSATVCGTLSEFVRQQDDARRSHDPIFSVAAIGTMAKDFTADAPVECFGRNSFWDRFHQADGVICNLNFDAGSTFVHYVERELNVEYRFDKTFAGTTILDGIESQTEAVYFCRRDLDDERSIPNFVPFDKKARELGVAKSESVGRGSVVSIKTRDVDQLIKSQLKIDPWFLTAAAHPVKQYAQNPCS
jgi:aminoglycoside 3-N-acetyltransferase